MFDFTRAPPSPRWRTLGDYLFASAVAGLAFALAFAAQRYLSVANLSPVFLTAVLVVAVRTRMAVAVYTAMLCFVGYNFFFTAPRFTLAIASADDVLAVGLFLLVALVCSHLATRLARQVATLRAAQWQARTLLDLGQQLARTANIAGIRAAGTAALAQALEARAAILLVADAGGPLETAVAVPSPPEWSGADLAAALWSRQQAQPAGAHVPGTPVSAYWFLPLTDVPPARAVVALALRGEEMEPNDARRGLARAMLRDMQLALERAELAEALEQARVQGETERLRSALLSSVSHDLRSPLAAMIGAAGTLSSYDAQLPPQERRELMESILEEGQRLDRYIQNLLDMTRLGHGTLKLNRDWVDASEIVLTAVGRLRRFHPALRVETTLPSATVLLYVHPALIEQALFNILENAAHFSPPEEPVRVTLQVAGEQLQITVSDRGPGIPEEERARIFDLFYSVSRGDRGHKGTGLGLSICRGMIGAHGGSVEALPGTGGGTTLRVTLPLPPAPEPGP
ncbi:sensor histidine kinase [Dyella sp.]|jgi:two-component system sensor histidine kinase KdpD|uniref:sensor histidine kinase n=1 Tax=Dyella sp. TaxID=1869338 RepID=UPI002D77305A|nr:ATP-binding protein [Dyella sp.]HET6430995.1 ATP-binding protein [Dyella sp.]